jgi:Asp-tRNA(Asn)/Glu-tRNA(Gln) amidotransferase A subunit family amidase
VIEQALDSEDALGLADLVRRRELGAGELLDAVIARAEARDPQFGFMAQRLYERAHAAIAAGLPPGPFHGVPWLLKDLNTDIAGERTGNGSRFYDGHRASATSELVTRIERAGFVIFGKTTTSEFGLTGTTENVGKAPTRNPWNAKRSAGGSSGGAAAAVAAWVLPAAHASDGGGSIRIPAACCGLFGLKPSRGRVPMGPNRTEGWGGMAVNHAVTRSVRDSAAILDVTHGVEPGSRYGAPTPDAPFLSQVSRDPGPLRIALMTQPLSGAPIDPEVVEVVEATARLLESLGHHVQIAAPQLDTRALGHAGFLLTASSVAADVADRAQTTGITAGPDTLEAITLAMIAFGQTCTGMDFARANTALQTAAVTVGRFMQDHDVILSPTLAAPALPLGQITLSPGVDFMEWGQRVSLWSPFAQLANMTGQPAMSLPLGMSRDGLPIGVMATGRYGEEALLFRLAGQIERAAPWAGRRAPIYRRTL